MIDLRSDTVTRPDAAMRRAMAEAEVGDDVFGEDPTVNLLQMKVAELLGKEAALFVPSGTMGNQICMNVHTEPGDEIICEAGSHVLNFESGSMAFLAGAQPRPIIGRHGVFTVEQVREAMRAPAYYLPRTRLIVIENTHNLAGGTIFPLDEIRRIADFARSHDLRMHLDGARLWNASVATGISLNEYSRHFDSVSVCLSKGLGAPVGSVIAGSKEFIQKAHRLRKQLGGGMRQVGILAAAGIYAIEHNLARLEEDHRKARRFAEIVAGARGIRLDMETVQTNIVVMDIEGKATALELLERLAAKGVLLVPMGAKKLRAVTHLDVSMQEVETAAQIVRQELDAL
ncbi:MAG: low-specificity L-threonine aldolase [candidate division KSB1 bacterium]|nr:low-specificity L-threonine aldolase [candidate division KSB1 bacterium]